MAAQRQKRARGLQGATIIVDLDGALVDTAGDLAAGMNHGLASIGVDVVPSGSVRHLVDHGARAILVHGYKMAVGSAPDAALIDAALAH